MLFVAVPAHVADQLLLACMAAVSSPHAVAETYTWLGGTVDVHSF